MPPSTAGDRRATTARRIEGVGRDELEVLRPGQVVVAEVAQARADNKHHNSLTSALALALVVIAWLAYQLDLWQWTQAETSLKVMEAEAPSGFVPVQLRNVPEGSPIALIVYPEGRPSETTCGGWTPAVVNSTGADFTIPASAIRLNEPMRVEAWNFATAEARDRYHWNCVAADGQSSRPNLRYEDGTAVYGTPTPLADTGFEISLD